MDPKDPDVLYAGTITDGVYYTEDRGDTWQPMHEGIHHELTIALAIDPADNRRIYAGFEGGGVYRIQKGSKFLRPDSDHDLDQIPSIWEQYLNLDPLSPNHSELATTMNVTLAESNKVKLQWYKGILQPEEPVTAIVQWSRDLTQWTPLSALPGAAPYGNIQSLGNANGFNMMEADITNPEPELPLFLRLELIRE